MNKTLIALGIVLVFLIVGLGGCSDYISTSEEKQLYEKVVEKINSISLETLSLEEDEHLGSAELYVDKFEDAYIEQVTGIDGIDYYKIGIDYVLYWIYDDYEESHVYLAKGRIMNEYIEMKYESHDYSYHAFFNYWDSSKIFDNPCSLPCIFSGKESNVTPSFKLDSGKKVKIHVTGIDFNDLTLCSSPLLKPDLYSYYVTSFYDTYSWEDNFTMEVVDEVDWPYDVYNSNEDKIESGLYYFAVSALSKDWAISVEYI